METPSDIYLRERAVYGIGLPHSELFIYKAFNFQLDYLAISQEAYIIQLKIQGSRKSQ